MTIKVCPTNIDFEVIKNKTAEKLQVSTTSITYCCLIGNENNASISILDIQDYAHLVVHTHEAILDQ